jgi:hypothetical protein
MKTMIASQEFDFSKTSPHFNGSDIDPDTDTRRLTGQIQRIYTCMMDGVWRTLGEIQDATNDPQASISAQLRNLRKPRFGSHTISKQHRGNRDCGLWEYRLEPLHFI